MVSGLTIAGVVQGRLWQTGAPWMVSVDATRPYWLLRTMSGIPLAAGFMALLYGFLSGPRGAGLQSVAAHIGVEPVTEIAPRFAAGTAASEAG
jgi:hypothetical protein